MANAEAMATAPSSNEAQNARGRGGATNRGSRRGGQGRSGNNIDRRRATGHRGGDPTSSRQGRNGARQRGDTGNSEITSYGDAQPISADSSSGKHPTTAQPPPPQPGGSGVFGARLTRDAENDIQGKNMQAADAGEEIVEAEVCFICASPVTHSSVAPCNHRTCHICALRLRALYKTKACAHCRTEASTVIFTDDAEKRYEDYVQANFFNTNPHLGIAYESANIFEDTILLLRYNCPDQNCDVACMGWPDLHRHVRSVHQKVMCDLCTRNKKVFAHEHELFTQNELRKHEKYGDDNPGAVDQSGFKGHPECGFCRKRFYGDDELFNHCREHHERCHLCDQRISGQKVQYFRDYEALEQHFNKDHFPCLDRECLEKKFVVFDSQIDLKAHQLESHPNGLSKDARRNARIVDISAFDYRPQYHETRRGGPRAGRGRDPNSEPMPASTAGHMSRAEIAHQREREILSGQSMNNRTFGGQLTRPESQPQRAREPPQHQGPNDAQTTNTVTASAAPATDPRSFASMTPQEQARQLRHNAVTERAANLLGNERVKLDQFRERVSSFRNNVVTAKELIESFFSLFDTSSAELGKLVKELAEIFEIQSKRDELLKAWNDWKAINEDYPSLPAPPSGSTAAGLLGAGVGGSRVLKLKSATAQSSRSAIGTQRSWGSAGSSVTNARNPFPALPAASASSTTAKPSGWLALRPAGTSSGQSSGRASPVPAKPRPSADTKNSELFPALPAAKKPTSTVFSPGYRGAGVIRQDVGPSRNAWGLNSNEDPVSTSTPQTVEPDITSKGKGKKGKKQLVMQWG